MAAEIQIVGDEVLQLPFVPLPASTVGPRGYTGATGAAGADGAPGADGAAGADGANGAPGADGTDGADGADGADGVGVPAGGTAGQILSKIDGTDYNTEWIAPSGGGGGDLQAAYDASTSTEITTDATRGAVTVKRGSAADTDNIIEGKNAAGTNTFSVTGNGLGTFADKLVAEKNLVVGTSAISTSATDGFIYLGSCAGKPTGTPTTETGRVPLVYDSTNLVFWAYSGGAWKVAGADSSAFECPLGGTIADATYTMVAYATFPFNIVGIYGLKHTSGSSTLAVKINGTAVTGLGALSVTSTAQNATASAANAVAIGDAVNFVISSGSTPVDLLSTLKIVRTG